MATDSNLFKMALISSIRHSIIVNKIIKKKKLISYCSNFLLLNHYSFHDFFVTKIINIRFLSMNLLFNIHGKKNESVIYTRVFNLKFSNAFKSPFHKADNSFSSYSILRVCMIQQESFQSKLLLTVHCKYSSRETGSLINCDRNPVNLKTKHFSVFHYI